jgi:peptidyl-dipeptidase A
MKTLLVATCIFVFVSLLTACPNKATPKADSQTNAQESTATAFVQRAAGELEILSRHATLADFTNGADGTPEHAQELKEAQTRYHDAFVPLWKGAARFSDEALPTAIARQIKILRVPPATPAPFDAKLASELFATENLLTTHYTDAQDCVHRSPCRTKKQLYEILDTKRDPEALLSAWSEWHDAGAAIRAPYARSVELLNLGARDYGQPDAGATLRAQYEMSPAAFTTEYDRLWGQVRPLYEGLHCHVRAKLHERYGALVPENGPIPAHLLGNMWGQYWQNIDELLGIPKGPNPIDVTKALKDKNIKPLEMVRMAEDSFRSMGFPELPKTFWEKSVFAEAPHKTVDCHASACPSTRPRGT